jgi:aspartyl-tRNA(Asn)/glutamyl-tRNA(Gln) amidotransferase subunit C
MNKPTIGRDTVKKIAELAKLKLEDQEIDILTPQLAQILDYVSQLKNVNTDDVEPLSQVNNLKNISRDDVVSSSLSKEDSLSSSLKTKGDFFVADAVINYD